MLEAAGGAVHAEAQLVHVALLDIVHRVLVRAVRLLAHAEFEQVPADRHLGQIVLVQEAACLAFHAQERIALGMISTTDGIYTLSSSDTNRDIQV